MVGPELPLGLASWECDPRHPALFRFSLLQAPTLQSLGRVSGKSDTQVAGNGSRF